MASSKFAQLRAAAPEKEAADDENKVVVLSDSDSESEDEFPEFHDAGKDSPVPKRTHEETKETAAAAADDDGESAPKKPYLRDMQARLAPPDDAATAASANGAAGDAIVSKGFLSGTRVGAGVELASVYAARVKKEHALKKEQEHRKMIDDAMTATLSPEEEAKAARDLPLSFEDAERAEPTGRVTYARVSAKDVQLNWESLIAVRSAQVADGDLEIKDIKRPEHPDGEGTTWNGEDDRLTEFVYSRHLLPMTAATCDELALFVRARANKVACDLENMAKRARMPMEDRLDADGAMVIGDECTLRYDSRCALRHAAAFLNSSDTTPTVTMPVSPPEETDPAKDVEKFKADPFGFMAGDMERYWHQTQEAIHDGWKRVATEMADAEEDEDDCEARYNP